MKSPQHVDRGRGFTLVEVMVSLVVLSLGLLGVAKMVMLSSHSNDSAYLRTQATALAYEMLDYMRATPPVPRPATKYGVRPPAASAHLLCRHGFPPATTLNSLPGTFTSGSSA